MIDPSHYTLLPHEAEEIHQLLKTVGDQPTLEQLWALMDQVWKDCGCDNRLFDRECYARFYSHPIWLLNGMFIEQHEVSMGHRRAIAAAVAELSPQQVVDFGGGFGTLARLMALASPTAEIHICEPYPPRYGLESCRPYSNIHFVPELVQNHYDVLVSTDVLEHVPDPLELLASMVASVRLGGHLLIANCFYPVIQCHLPATFHLRYSFDRFCRELGLERIGPCEGSHATIYRRNRLVEPDWLYLRRLEHRSQRQFSWRGHLSSWLHRARVAVRHPFHYPRRLAAALESRL